MGIGKEGEVLHLGVTATPNRTDKREMHSIFDECVYNKSLFEMIQQGWLCDLRCRIIETEIDISSAKKGEDYNPDDLAALIDTRNCNDLIVTSFKKFAGDRVALGFCTSVGHAISLATAFNRNGIKAQAVYHKMGDEARAQALEDYANGDIQILTNFNILTEGYDNPRTDCILMARPTSSTLLYTQMIGRGTRTHPEKKDCLILDVACISNKRDIMELPSLFGLEKPPDKEEPIVAHMQRLKRLPKASPEELGSKIHSKVVDLFSRTNFAWIKITNGYALSLASDGTLLLKEDEKKYRVFLERRGEELKELTVRKMSLEWAQGLAEDYARDVMQGKARLMDLVNKDAGWRKEPATEKQIQILTKRRVRIKPNLTRGEASDTISRMFSDNGATQKQMSALRRLRITFNPKTLTKGQAGRLLANAAGGRKPITKGNK